MSAKLNAAAGGGIAPVRRPKSLTASARDSIRAGIRDGLLEQGALYSEGELAAAMGISRTPVREALIELSREGLVEILPQHGFRLRSLSKAAREEIFALRMAVESLAVERLARQAGKPDVARLRGCLDEQRRLGADSPSFLEADEAMHLLIPELAGLPRTRDVLLTIRGSILLMGSLALTLPERAEQVIAEHEAIVEAIAAQDPGAAVAAVGEHLETTLAASNRGEGSSG